MEAHGAFDHFEPEAENGRLGQAQHFLKVRKQQKHVPPCKIFKIYSAMHPGSLDCYQTRILQGALSTKATLLLTTVFHSSKTSKKAPNVNNIKNMYGSYH